MSIHHLDRDFVFYLNCCSWYVVFVERAFSMIYRLLVGSSGS